MSGAKPEPEQPASVSMHLCTTSVIPRRVLSTKELQVILSNAERVWMHCISDKPLLIAMVELSVDDLLIHHRLRESLAAIYDEETLKQDFVGCVRAFLKLCVVLFCMYSSTEVAYKMLSKDKHGTFMGLFSVTRAILKMEVEPIQFDIQYGYLTNAIWISGHHTDPTRPIHAALKSLTLFEMQFDHDMRELVRRVMQICSSGRVAISS